jgi:GPH family glycoside/pentoside/hexuronide:cation symporter
MKRGDTVETTIAQSAPSESEKISIWERLAYGCGDAGFNIVWASLTTFIVFFFTDIAAIPPAIVSVILLVGRIFDGSDDVVAGWLVDRTRSRFGKARPWILWLVLPFGILTVMLFTVPNISLTGKIIYAGVVYFVINDLYSFINIPYGTLNAMITQDQYQRSLLNLTRMIMAILATIFVSSATVGFVEMLGGGAAAWQRMYMIYALVAMIFLMITFLFTRERVKPGDASKSKSTVPFKVAAVALLKNRYLWLIIGAMILAFISQGLGGTAIYFAQYVLGDVQLIAMLQLAANVPVLVGMFLIAPLIKKFSKRTCTLAGAILMVIGSFIIMINPMSLPIVLVGSLIKALGMAPVAGVGGAMVLDTIEYGDWKTGVRSEGLISSMASLATKFGIGFGAALIGWALAVGKYVANAVNQAPTAITAIQMCFVYIPAVLAIIILVLLWFFDLDRIYPKVSQELRERNQQVT